MKKQIQLAVLALLLSTLNPQLSTAFGQGALTPPGAPAPLFKTLSQVEPRTPISSLPFVITNSGGYYVTTNLFGVENNNGITVSANYVTLDLGGFTLTGVLGSLAGINVNVGNARGLVVRNGTVANWGQNGINAASASLCSVTDVIASKNGAQGIAVGQSSVVGNCLAADNATDGIYADAGSTITRCTSRANTNGIVASAESVVTDCTASGNLRDGIAAGGGARVAGCTARDNKLDGIFVLSASVESCVTLGNLRDGIAALASATISHCAADANGRHGIFAGLGANPGQSAISYCTATGNGTNGIYASSSSSVTHCTVNDNLVGIRADASSSVTDCTAERQIGDGILIGSGCSAQNNLSTSSGWLTGSGAGIHVTGFGNRIDNNHLAFGDWGLLVTGSTNFITRNTASANGTNYSITGIQTIGPIISASGTIVTNHPWANFAF